MKEKLVKISKRKRIGFISIALLIVTIFVGITFATFNGNIETTSNELVEDNKEDIPDVTSENTNFEISEKIVTLSSKLENFNLYYCIKTKQELEMKEEEIQESEEVKTEENKIEDYILFPDKIEIETNSNVYFKYEKDGKYSENPYILEMNHINKEEVMEEQPTDEKATEEELQKEKVEEKDKTAKYYVIVNYRSNVVTVYGKDANNEYTVPVKAMVCSTGIDTPRSGVYKLTTTRYRWRALFGGVYGQYAVKIVGNILFHSVPYLSTDNGTLEYWEYDKLGTAASAGCVRLTVTDALWIYNNCGSGTQVEFSSNSGNPLGKPTARKISSYQDLRGYDPTDPASNNPWRKANISNNTNTNKPKDNSSKGNVNINKPEKEKEEKPDNSNNSAQTSKEENKSNNNINNNANNTNNNITLNNSSKTNTENKNADKMSSNISKENTKK